MMAMTIGATVALALAGATEEDQKPTLDVVAKVTKLEDGVVLVERELTKTKLALLRRRGIQEVSREEEITDGSIFDGRLYVAYPMIPELTQSQGDAKKWIGRKVKLKLRRNEFGRWSIEKMSFP